MRAVWTAVEAGALPVRPTVLIANRSGAAALGVGATDTAAEYVHPSGSGRSGPDPAGHPPPPWHGGRAAQRPHQTARSANARALPGPRSLRRPGHVRRPGPRGGSRRRCADRMRNHAWGGGRPRSRTGHPVPGGVRPAGEDLPSLRARVQPDKQARRAEVLGALSSGASGCLGCGCRADRAVASVRSVYPWVQTAMVAWPPSWCTGRVRRTHAADADGCASAHGDGAGPRMSRRWPQLPGWGRFGPRGGRHVPRPAATRIRGAPAGAMGIRSTPSG